MEKAFAESIISNDKMGYYSRFRNFLSDKKTKVIGSIGLMLGLASGCMTLDKKITLDDYFIDRYVTVTGEVHPGYWQDPEKNDNLNVPIIIYDSVGPDGKPLVMNLHEDHRFGINRQALKRAKTAFNKKDYVVKAWGHVTRSKILNIDLEFVAFTDKDGKLASTVETDVDPIYTLPGAAPLNFPGISTQPELNSWFWNSWALNNGIWDGDYDNDGIRDGLDPYPTIPFLFHPCEINVKYHNPLADFNSYKAKKAIEPDTGEGVDVVKRTDKKIDYSDLSLRPEAVKLFYHNHTIDENKRAVRKIDSSVEGNNNSGLRVVPRTEDVKRLRNLEDQVKVYSTEKFRVRPHSFSSGYDGGRIMIHNGSYDPQNGTYSNGTVAPNSIIQPGVNSNSSGRDSPREAEQKESEKK
jgi:hypothetical protein